MGLKSRTGGSITYLNVMFGKLVQKVNADREGAQKRFNKKGDEVWELHHDSFEGRLIEASINPGNFGETIDLVFEDDGKRYKISMLFESSYGRSFLFKIPNINTEELMILAPYSFEDGDRTVTGITVYQEGDKLGNFWTKEEPGKLPDLEVIKRKGKPDMYDDGDRMEFLKKAFEHAFGGMEPPAQEEKEPEKEAVIEEEDDLPF